MESKRELELNEFFNGMKEFVHLDPKAIVNVLSSMSIEKLAVMRNTANAAFLIFKGNGKINDLPKEYYYYISWLDVMIGEKQPILN
jgi:hypothetical protein